MTSSRTARVEREQRKADSSERLDRLLREHQITQAAVALELGVGETMVAEWCKPEKPRSMPFSDAIRLPEGVRRALAQDLVGDGCALVTLPMSTSEACDLRAAAAVQRRSSTVVSELLDAMADAHFDAAEGERIEQACDALIASTLLVRERARAAVRERVVPIRRDGARR